MKTFKYLKKKKRRYQQMSVWYILPEGENIKFLLLAYKNTQGKLIMGTFFFSAFYTTWFKDEAHLKFLAFS